MAEFEIKEMQQYAKNVVYPVMVEYTKWVVYQCQHKNIKKIYFLARDGYLLHLIAKKICEVNNINLEIRYLYCSRYSLRIPTFNLIGDEKYSTLFLKSCKCTLKTVLKRAGLTDAQCAEISNLLKINKDKILDNMEFHSVKEKLIKNEQFNKILTENSVSAYDNIIKYFNQEKLFEDDIVIVDSGWTGSMQRSIRQLADSVGFNKKIIGFYFGMFKKPQVEDGEYLTYYFSSKGGIKRKINFNNNLFECMLSANHGMTMGYEVTKEKVVPVMQSTKEDIMKKIVQMQIDCVMNKVENCKNDLSIKDFDLNKSCKFIYKILKRAMIYPTEEEIKMLSNIYFCDDVTGDYQKPLVDKNSLNLMRANCILPLIFRRIFKKKYMLDKVYWPYGVITYSKKILRPWYRFNFKFLYFLRYTLFNKL